MGSAMGAQSNMPTSVPPIPMSSAMTAAQNRLLAKGTLRVLVQHAENLTYPGAKCDPYVRIKMGKQDRRTSSVKDVRTRSVEWGETLEFAGQLLELLELHLDISLWDYDKYSRNDKLAEGSHSLASSLQYAHPWLLLLQTLTFPMPRPRMSVRPR